VWETVDLGEHLVQRNFMTDHPVVSEWRGSGRPARAYTDDRCHLGRDRD
jgi:hypothetical protein